MSDKPRLERLKGLNRAKPIRSRIGLLEANREDHKSFITGTMVQTILIPKDQAQAMGIKPRRVYKGK